MDCAKSAPSRWLGRASAPGPSRTRRGADAFAQPELSSAIAVIENCAGVSDGKPETPRELKIASTGLAGGVNAGRGLAGALHHRDGFGDPSRAIVRRGFRGGRIEAVDCRGTGPARPAAEDPDRAPDRVSAIASSTTARMESRRSGWWWRGRSCGRSARAPRATVPARQRSDEWCCWRTALAPRECAAMSSSSSVTPRDSGSPLSVLSNSFRHSRRVSKSDRVSGFIRHRPLRS